VTDRAGCKRAVAEGSPIDPGLARTCRSAFTEGFSQGATSRRDRTLHTLLLDSLLALAAMTLASAAFGWLMAGRVLRPVHAITDAAHRASQDNLGDRIALSGPDATDRRKGAAAGERAP
jgi:hypothetical protein